MTTQQGSLNDMLRVMSVGQCIYIESTTHDYLNVMRRVTVKSRYPDSMRDFQFSCNSYTAVGSKKMGDIKYLVRVERIK